MKKFILYLFLYSTLVSCQNYGKKIIFNGTEIYYKNGVTKEQATVLGNYLTVKEFTDGNTKSVQFIKDSKTKNLTFRMVVNEEVASNNKMDYIFTTFGRNLMTKFKQPVDFELCDSSFKTLKTYSSNDYPQIIDAKKTQIVFTNNVTKEDTQNLANYLIESEFADDKNPKSILFDKQNEIYIFKMVVYKGAEKEEANIKLLNLFSKELSEKIFKGKPLKLHLCDDNMNTLKIAE